MQNKSVKKSNPTTPKKTLTETQKLGNLTGNSDKKSMTTSKNDKTKEKCWNMLGQKGKSNTSKNDNTIWNKPKEERLKRYWDRIKQYRQNRTLQKNEKNSTN